MPEFRHLASADDGSLERLIEAIAASDGSLWLMDAETWRCLALSRKAAEQVGYEPDELVGHTLDELLRSEFQDWETPRAEVLEEGHVKGVTVNRHKDGTPVTVAYDSHLLRIDGREMTLATTTVVEREPELDDDLLQRLEERGVPQGMWLLEIEEAREHLRGLDSVLRRLHEAIVKAAAAAGQALRGGP